MTLERFKIKHHCIVSTSAWNSAIGSSHEQLQLCDLSHGNSQKMLVYVDCCWWKIHVRQCKDQKSAFPKFVHLSQRQFTELAVQWILIIRCAPAWATLRDCAPAWATFRGWVLYEKTKLLNCKRTVFRFWFCDPGQSLKWKTTGPWSASDTEVQNQDIEGSTRWQIIL